MKILKFFTTYKIIIFFIISVNPIALAQTENTPPLSAQFNSQTQQPIVYKYYGCSFSNKFHRPGCKFAKAISKHHLVLFQWRKQAIAAHYQPCRYCLPPVWLSTHAVLIAHPEASSHNTDQHK